MLKVLTTWLDAFAEASPRRKLLLVVLTVLPVAALVAAYLWLNQPPYRVLFPRLSDQAGGEVMAALEQLDITYRLSEKEGAIEVPADQVYAARFKLAARGLPKSDARGLEPSGSGPTFGLSQFQEQLRYQHALEAALVRSIETFDAVAAARVHLALPKVSPFLRDPPPVTAAVLVQLKPKKTLTNEQVSAIQRMVAASVPRLKMHDVSVLDPQGHTLGGLGTGTEARGATLEIELTQRLVQGLAPLMGAGRFNVQVTPLLSPEGQLRRVNATVILPPDTRPEVIDKATLLARQAIGFDARRGDGLSVFALPATPAPAPPVESPPKAVTLAPRPQPALRPDLTDWLPWLLGAGAVGLLALAGLRLRSRSAPADPPENLLTEDEAFDQLLQASRRQTLDNPRVTADVIRLWMRA